MEFNLNSSRLELGANEFRSFILMPESPNKIALSLTN